MAGALVKLNVITRNWNRPFLVTKAVLAYHPSSFWSVSSHWSYQWYRAILHLPKCSAFHQYLEDYKHFSNLKHSSDRWWPKQKRMDPSFLVFRAVGNDQGLSLGSMTPCSNILSTYSSAVCCLARGTPWLDVFSGGDPCISTPYSTQSVLLVFPSFFTNLSVFSRICSHTSDVCVAVNSSGSGISATVSILEDFLFSLPLVPCPGLMDEIYFTGCKDPGFSLHALVREYHARWSGSQEPSYCVPPITQNPSLLLLSLLMWVDIQLHKPYFVLTFHAWLSSCLHLSPQSYRT